QWFVQMRTRLGGRVLAIDEPIAEAWAQLGIPDPLPFTDGLLAATAKVHGLTLVTRNVADIATTGALFLHPFAAQTEFRNETSDCSRPICPAAPRSPSQRPIRHRDVVVHDRALALACGAVDPVDADGQAVLAVAGRLVEYPIVVDGAGRAQARCLSDLGWAIQG